MSLLLAAAEAVVEPSVGSAEWWSTFTRSAGFGGVAAVVAAVVALFTAGRRNRAERLLAGKARYAQVEDNAADRWWAIYQWTLDQAGTMEPPRVLRLLKELDAQAPGDAERALVSVAIDIFVGEEE
ncbi:MAG TPA: hypothetical protein VGC57_09095 [Cellulomonas sp.]